MDISNPTPSGRRYCTMRASFVQSIYVAPECVEIVTK